MKIINLIFEYILSLSPKKRRLIRISIDAFLIPFAIAISALFFLEISSINFRDNYLLMILSVVLGIPIYALTGQYKGLTRYVGSNSLYKLATRNILLVLILFLVGSFFDFYSLSLKKWILLYLLITIFTGLIRFILRDILLSQNFINNKQKTNVVIFGAGSAGAQLLATLRLAKSHNVLGFLDDNPELWKRSINGIKISNPRNFDKLYKVDEILLAIPSLSKTRRREIIKQLEIYNLPILKIPSIENLTSGGENIDDLSPITVEDLLGRDTVLPDPRLLGPGITNSTICVTGAGGSIGSELCRKIIKIRPKKLIILENSEQNLYLLEQELITLNLKEIKIITILGSATNKKLLIEIFGNYNVDIVFHAAAYKHVPLVEKNPIEGIYNNVFSTRKVCESASITKVKKVILISTDKAVRPANVLGASKRLAELVVQAFAEEEEKNNKKQSKTIFTMVRFGNVLGSSGSVVPLFEKQIRKGGPITLTHREIIRYFMTISEAAQLVIQASVLAKGGDVLLLDMGEPVKIYDLACQMIKLSGLKIKDSKNNKSDIEILTTGLRPGEKLYEELLIDSKAEPTQHKLIYRANEKNISPNKLWADLDILENELIAYKKDKVIKILQKLIPEWKMSKC